MLLTGCVLYTQCNYLSSKYHHSVEWSCHMKNRFGTIVAYCWKIIINFLFSSKKKFHNDTDEFCCFSSNTSTHFKPISAQSPWSVTLMVEISLWDRTLHPKYDLAGLAPCGHCRVPWPTPTTSAPEGPLPQKVRLIILAVDPVSFASHDPSLSSGSHGPVCRRSSGFKSICPFILSPWLTWLNLVALDAVFRLHKFISLAKTSRFT